MCSNSQAEENTDSHPHLGKFPDLSIMSGEDETQIFDIMKKLPLLD